MYNNVVGQHAENRNAVVVPDKYPALDKLGLEVTTIDNKELGGVQRASDLDNAKFNGCIFEHAGFRFMCYRAYSHKTNRSNIFVSMLEGTKPTGKHYELDLPGYAGDVQQYEDARFFTHRGKLYLSYVVVEYTQTWWAGIHVVRLNPYTFKVEKHWVPKYDNNCVNNPQKNWIFFSEDGHLRCVFDTKCHEVLTLNDDFEVQSNTVYKPTIWDKGLMRGGTTPLRLEDGKWLAFFHSSVEHGQRRRRYSMTPYIFSVDKIHSIGSTIWGSTENPVVDVRTTSVWWNPIVVFPMGIIDDGDDYLVSVGVNDLYNAIVRMPKKWVLDQMPIENYHKFDPRYFFWNKATQLGRFSSYKILKTGGQGQQIVGSIADPDQYAYIKENLTGMQWITEQDYNDLIK